jgi:hypothetical protein
MASDDMKSLRSKARKVLKAGDWLDKYGPSKPVRKVGRISKPRRAALAAPVPFNKNNGFTVLFARWTPQLEALELTTERCLNRQNLTYLGMPAEEALDIKALRPVIKNVICVARDSDTIAETARSIASLPISEKRFVRSDIWAYLRDKYPTEPLLADVAFLDFYGGSFVKENPFAVEIAALRAYFARHALSSGKAFVFAWTYMPHDKGEEPYRRILDQLKLSTKERDLLDTASGMRLRSIAIRLVLRQLLAEHGCMARVYHHAVYKNVMNTLILVYAKGTDAQCTLKLQGPEMLLEAPYYNYGPQRLRAESLLSG